MKLTKEIIRELLDYYPKTGKLFWKPRHRCWFKTENAYKTWNTRYAGKEAFTAVGSHGYLCGALFDNHYLAHRLIFTGMTGREPDEEIDHVNFNRTDNRWRNLQEVTKKQNRRHLQIDSKNKTGQRGIYHNSHSFIAQIVVNRKAIYLGSFKTLDKAVEARMLAEKQYWE